MKSRFIISTICLVAAAILAAAILIFTHLPNEHVPRLIVRIGDDKLRHLLSYGLFSALMFVGLRPWLPNPIKALACVVLIGTTFSIVDELTQPLTGRTCSLLDFLASFGGTLLGGSVMLVAAVFAGQSFRSPTAPAALSERATSGAAKDRSCHPFDAGPPASGARTALSACSRS